MRSSLPSVLHGEDLVVWLTWVVVCLRYRFSDPFQTLAMYGADIRLLATFHHWKSHKYQQHSRSKMIESVITYHTEECRQGSLISLN